MHTLAERRPRVSVIIPAHNAGQSLGACVRSVFAQTHPSWELIVVDDGSTDDTGTVARAYSPESVRYVLQENQGAGAARTHGMRLARGDLVAFLDADDLWTSTFLERTVAFLDSHADAIAVSTGFVVRSISGSEEIRPACIRSDGATGDPVVIEDFFEFWATYDHIHTSSVVMRRSAIENAGYMRSDLRIGQDLEYFGYMATFGKWGIIPAPLGINNSRLASAYVGWMTKYKGRRRLCPSVEAWQARILPRLNKSELEAFERVRGRVAAGYAHHMILGGNASQALRVVRDYGTAMPRTWLTQLLRLAAKLGPAPWSLVCLFLKVREGIKSVAYFLIVRVWRADPNAML